MLKKSLIMCLIVLGTGIVLVGCSSQDDGGDLMVVPETTIDGDKYGTGISGQGDIDDLYYLRAFGNPLHDFGTLKKTAPTRDEWSHCDRFLVFDYGETAVPNGTFTLENVYYHVWYNVSVGPETLQASVVLGAENRPTSFPIRDAVSHVGNYDLVYQRQDIAPISITGNDIFDLQIKFFRLFVDVIANPDQYSFVILNVPDRATLATLDTDNDGLNDEDELYVSITNPYDTDTDNDGVDDDTEVTAGTDPNDFNDF